MAHDDELEALERELAGVSARLADERRFEDLEPGLRRALRRPLWDVARTLTVALGLAAAGGLLDSSGLIAAGLALGVVLLPRQLRAARDRVRRLGRPDGELFAECAREVERRFTSQVLVLVFGLPAALALLAAWAGVPERHGPLVLAGLIVLYLPYHVLVAMRATLRESKEVERWADLDLADARRSSTTAQLAQGRPSAPLLRKLHAYLYIATASAALVVIVARIVERLFEPGYHVPTALLAPVVGFWILLRLIPVPERPEEAGAEDATADGDGGPETSAESAGADGSTDEGIEDEDEEDDDEEDVSWPRLVAELLGLSLRAGLLYLGPFAVLYLLVAAAMGDSPARSLTVAAGITLAWIVQWFFFLPEDEDEDGEAGR